MEHSILDRYTGWFKGSVLVFALFSAGAISGKCDFPSLKAYRVDQQQVSTDLYNLIDCRLVDHCSPAFGLGDPSFYHYGEIALLPGEFIRVEFGYYGDIGSCPTFQQVIKKDGNLIHLQGTGPTIVNVVEPGDYEVWHGDENSPFQDFRLNVLTFTIRGVVAPPDFIRVAMKLTLEGAKVSDSPLYLYQYQHKDLSQLGLTPISEPYSAMGYDLTEYTAEIPMAEDVEWPVECFYGLITDWVLVELRDANDPSIILASKAVVTNVSGDICDPSIGMLPVFDVPQGFYHVAVRHRNHLGVCTAEPVLLKDIPTTRIDFRLEQTPVWGVDTRICTTPTRCSLRAGDASQDGSVKYAGIGNDRDPILVRIGGDTPSATSTGYFPEDLNLDGEVKYAGANNDRDLILQMIGGLPTGMVQEQLP